MPLPISLPIEPGQPASGHRHSDSAYQTRLERLCSLLGVGGGRISQYLDGSLTTIAASGRQLEHVEDLAGKALRQGSPLVLADHGTAVGFYVGIVLPKKGGPAPLVLSLFDSRPRSASVARAMAAMASEVLALAALKRHEELLDRQVEQLAGFAAEDEQRRTLFERASATAKLGIWQCELGSERLTWTNGVYDIFELPHQAPITREMILEFYTPESRRLMAAARSHALAHGSDFSVDVEITTPKGNRRWVRLTGAVESRGGVPSRIFGVKQDITEERLLSDRTRYLAEFDVMTGLANRGTFQAYLDTAESKAIGALVLVDLDGFKKVNDTFGHAVGDACLKEAANRLLACCGDAVLVARIGGDEFAVLASAAASPQAIEAMARGIVWTMGQPLHCLGHALDLGASVGVAHHHSGSADDLFRQADAALYAAKDAGRNTSRVFSRMA